MANRVLRLGMSDRTDTRLPELDGLRGWAALSVFVWHAFDVFHPALIGGPLPDGEYTPDALHRLARSLPLGAAFNGQFAVYVFFTLSGFVLTHQMIAGRMFARGYELIAHRWLRLLPVVVVGSALSFAVLWFGLLGGLDEVAAAGGVRHRTLYEPGVYHQLTPWEWVRQTFGTVWAGQPANELFNRVLWTIGIEFQCSVLVYAGAVVFRPMRNRAFAHLVMGFTGLCVVGIHYLPFGVGVAAAEWWHSRPAAGGEVPRWRTWLGWGLVAAAVWAGGVHPDASQEVWLPFRSLLPECLRFASATNLLHTAAGGILLHAALTRPRLRAALRSRVSQAMGHISYPLYAVHQPLLYTVATAVFVWLFAAVGYAAAAMAAAGVTLALSAAVAAVVVRFVDTPLGRLSKRLVRRWADAAPPEASDLTATPQPAGRSLR